MKTSPVCTFSNLSNPDIANNFHAIQVIDRAATDCLDTDPYDEPQRAAALLAILFATVQEQQPKRIYFEGNDTSIMAQSYYALDDLWLEDDLELFEDPKSFIERNKRLNVYLEATCLLLSNMDLNPNNNPIVAALDS